MMKRILWALALCLIVSTASIAAHAETTIAIVDVQKILSDSKGAKDIQAQVKSYREKFMGELAKKEQSLREEEKSLIDQRASLSEDEFVAKRRAFEKKLLETRSFAQEKKKNLERAASESLRKLEGELIKAVQAVASEKSYSLVITKDNVIIGEKSMEITDRVMADLNNSLSKIPLNIKE